MSSLRQAPPIRLQVIAAACALLSVGIGGFVMHAAAPPLSASTTPADLERRVLRADSFVDARLGLVRDSVQDKDSINMRKDLGKRITRFHRTWRDAWTKSMIDRGLVNINLALTINDYSFRNFTPDAKRYESLMCSAGWIGEAGMANAEATLYGTNMQPPATADARVSATGRMVGAALAVTETDVGERATPVSQGFLNEEALDFSRRIRSGRNKGQICPRWLADEEVIPLDEGERIDLALPIPVRPRIRRSRDTVITRLSMAAARYPGDGWVSGQRVRFLVDNGDAESAVAAARECRASVAWCEALLGYAYEQGGNALAADSAFRRSVDAEFPQGSASCVDTTVFVMLSTGARRDAHNRNCGQQRALVERIWWLSDPLWSVPGNERLTVHYSRRTSVALRAAFDEDERYVWRDIAAGDALKETIVRYGWPTHTYWGGWSMDSAFDVARQSQMMEPWAPYTTKEYAPDRVALVPVISAIDSPFVAKAADWPMARPDSISLEQWWPYEHSALPTRITTLAEGQSFMLRRDSTLHYGIAIDDPVRQLDSRVRSLPRLLLLASSSPDSILVVADTVLPLGRTLRTGGTLLARPQVLSLEIPGRAPSELVHRRRFGVTPPPSLAQMAPGDVAVSHPVFVLLPRRGAPAPTDPDVVLETMTGSLELPRIAPLALYWESYGFVPGDTVDVEVRIARREDVSVLRRLGAALGVADGMRDSVSIAWREPDPGRSAQVIPARIATIARAISVDLRNLVAGEYDFSVEMTRPDGVRARGIRRVRIIE